MVTHCASVAGVAVMTGLKATSALVGATLCVTLGVALLSFWVDAEHPAKAIAGSMNAKVKGTYFFGVICGVCPFG